VQGFDKAKCMSSHEVDEELMKMLWWSSSSFAKSGNEVKIMKIICCITFVGYMT